MAKKLPTPQQEERRRKAAAKKFAEKWLAAPGEEKKETALFWIELLRKVYDVPDVEDVLRFEKGVSLSHPSYIDIQLPNTHVVIEQKSANVALDKEQRQSDGSMLTPYGQAKRYADNLKYKDRAKWIVTCNFREFQIHDMDSDVPSVPVCVLKLQDLPEQVHVLDFLIDAQITRVAQEKKVSIKAGEIIGRVYQALLEKSHAQDNPRLLHDLNKFCVRLVFCLYAEDAGLFRHGQFCEYLSKAGTPDDMEHRMQDLFRALNREPNDRNPHKKDLKEFPYVNGGLFDDDELFIPELDDELCRLILHEASEGFDWKGISPTIFGSLFESTLNPELRQQGGMFYTSIENIHKVIDPLFLDGLQAEFEEIRRSAESAIAKTRKLHALQDKIAGLTFLDPACGSGNFLTETFICLRRLENQILAELQGLETYKKRAIGRNQGQFGGEFSQIKVSIHQFYGIEINDFAVSVAKTALWIADAQMWEEAQEYSLIGAADFLPLDQQNGIREGNALRVDWLTDIPEGHVDYIIGNPPFEGAKKPMSAKQREDMRMVFGDMRLAQSLDYVFAWYKRAGEVMTGKTTQAAFVSTKSIVQGQQVALLGSVLKEHELNINFAHQSFKWNNEARQMAQVNCVIIGFSGENLPDKRIYLYKGKASEPTNVSYVHRINAYLREADDIHVARRPTPICEAAPIIYFGNMPNDSCKKPKVQHQYIFDEQGKDDFLQVEPQAAQFFRPFVKARNYIHGGNFYCLWLKNAKPDELQRCPRVKARVSKVQEIRLASTAKATREKGEKTPELFFFISHPDKTYLLIPATSSENREYIPMGFMDAETIASNSCLIIPDATMYHFGVLTSKMHMAWTQAVCGRLEGRPRYSNDVVYNNFPWPEPTETEKEHIEKCAQAVLDVRARYKGSTLAALYDPVLMPADLRKAHRALDAAVDKAYSDKPFKDDAARVAYLFGLYQDLVSGK